jgi:hypothetical protein
MSEALFVMTPSALATELVSHFQASRRDSFKILSYGKPIDVELPQGSAIVNWPTYGGFLRYLDQNKFSHVVFVANLAGFPSFWLEALFDGRVLRRLLDFDVPDVKFLLGLVDFDLRARDISILHPHDIDPPTFQLEAGDQFFRRNHVDITQRFREFFANYRRPAVRSFLIVRESVVFGMNRNGEFEEIASERTSTDALLGSLCKLDLSKYERIVLYKTGADQSYVTYPVIGPITLQNCNEAGVTDIVLNVDFVIQGKNNTLQRARSYNISLISLSSQSHVSNGRMWEG